MRDVSMSLRGENVRAKTGKGSKSNHVADGCASRAVLRECLGADRRLMWMLGAATVAAGLLLAPVEVRALSLPEFSPVALGNAHSASVDSDTLPWAAIVDAAYTGTPGAPGTAGVPTFRSI